LQLDNITDLVNTDIRLRESDHTYILKSKPTIGFCNVTDLVGDQFPPFEREKLARWLVNTSNKYNDYTEVELLQEWEDIKDEGSAVHKELENYILSGKIPQLPKAISGMNWFDQEIEFYGDKVFPEIIVFSEELEVAGTIVKTYAWGKNQNISILINKHFLEEREMIAEQITYIRLFNCL